MIGIKVPTLVIIGFVCLFFIVPFWKIFGKAGFPRLLSLLMILPFVNILLLFYVAFARWPARREVAAVEKKALSKKASQK